MLSSEPDYPNETGRQSRVLRTPQIPSKSSVLVVTKPVSSTARMVPHGNREVPPGLLVDVCRGRTDVMTSSKGRSRINEA